MNTTSHPPIAVVILNYNGRHWLEKFLPSVIRHTSKELARIWVADNASTDDSIDLVKQHFPEVSTFKMPENYGFAGGYNHAIEHIKAEYILLLNSDVEVSEGWLRPMLQCLKDNANTAACQPKIMSYNEPNKFEYAGAAGGYIDKFGYPFCRGRIFDTTEEDYGQYNTATEIFWASGACMLIKRALFLQAGGFDTDFFAHMEEIDLCWRLKNMGYSIRYVPNAKVYHVGGGTLSSQSSHKLFLNFRNNRLMLFKNLDKSDIFLINFIRNFLDIIAIVRNIIKFNWKDAFSIIKAHWSYIILLSKFAEKRAIIDQKIQKHSIGRPNRSGRYYKSIIWLYFFRKKKFYRDLSW